MASRHIVQEALTDLATTFNRPPSWVERALELWTEHLKSIPDGALLATVNTIVSTQTAMPTIAEIRAACASQQATSGSLGKPQGCPDCDGTGARQMAWHRTTRFGITANTYAGACSCPRGEQLKPSLGSWKDIRDQWLKDPNTVEVYVSDRTHALTLEETHGPDNATVRAMKAGPSVTPDNGFKKLAHKLQRGHRPDERKRQPEYVGDEP